jgi:lambda repressor-like predicted transcriptional regulator
VEDSREPIAALYFAAIQAGLDRNYARMERIFAEVIDRSLAGS